MKKIISRFFRNYSFYVLLFVTLVICSAIEADAAPVKPADRREISAYVRAEYGRGYKIRIAPAEDTPDRVLEHRVGKRLVYVDQFVTRSRGRYGVVTTSGPFRGHRIQYTKRHKRGKMVVVYLVYNPYSNYTDDVVYTVER